MVFHVCIFFFHVWDVPLNCSYYSSCFRYIELCQERKHEEGNEVMVREFPEFVQNVAIQILHIYHAYSLKK